MKKILIGIIVVIFIVGTGAYIISKFQIQNTPPQERTISKSKTLSSTTEEKADTQLPSSTVSLKKESLCPPKFNTNGERAQPEKIVVAAEEETVKKYPEWRIRAQEVVNYINAVLAKNTSKRYEIGKFSTFALTQYNTLGWNPDYHFDNGYGGTTLFWYVHPQAGPAKEITGSSLVNAMSSNDINGKTFYNLWLVENEVGAIIKGREILTKEMGWEHYFDEHMSLFLHELGHSLGLAYGEWYTYDFKDRTGILPNLGTYSFKEMYPKEPMASANTSEYEYSDFSTYIINRNLTHQYSPFDISRFHAVKTMVRVKNANGNPIPRAVVKVFGAKKNCFYCKPLTKTTIPLQTLETDDHGETEIENVNADFNLEESATTGWIAKIIKTSYNTRTAGAVTTLVDSQKSCIINGADVHYIDLTL